jgi:hypothetical protein
MAKITLSEVYNAIQCMCSTAPGTDRITIAMLQLLPAQAIFNQCLEGQHILLTWKEATITLLYKDSDQADPGNYWPISLLQENILSSRDGLALQHLTGALIEGDVTANVCKTETAT